MLRQCDLFDRIVVLCGRLLGNRIALLVSGLFLQIDKALLLLTAQLVVILLCVIIVIVFLAAVVPALLCAYLVRNRFRRVLIKFV